jgi:hypothetical protein
LVTRELLERVKAVPKAAFCKPPDERPAALMHLSSLVVADELLEAPEILVVDDAVTRGTMLLACVLKLQAAFPKSQIRAFALLRAMSSDEVEELTDPCSGKSGRAGIGRTGCPKFVDRRHAVKRRQDLEDQRARSRALLIASLSPWRNDERGGNGGFQGRPARPRLNLNVDNLAA